MVKLQERQSMLTRYTADVEKASVATPEGTACIDVLAGDLMGEAD